MALHKKYTDLPDLDSAPEIYETPDLTDGDSAVPTTTVPSFSDHELDEQRTGDTAAISRARLRIDEARSKFMPTNVDARDVDFSDRVGSKRKSYKTSSRRHRVFEDGTEEFGDLSDDEDDAESLARKMARLRRELMEAKEEYGKQQAASKTETADVTDDLDGQITWLSQVLEDMSHLTERRPLHSTTAAAAAEGVEVGKESTQAEPTAPSPPHSATYTMIYDPTYEQTHALAKAADFDRRLVLLEQSLGIGSSAMPGLDAGRPPRAVVPALETLQKQLSTLEGASTSSLDAISRRVRALTQEAENLDKARRSAKAAQDALASTVAAPDAAPETTAGDVESAQQTAKINALYGTLPTIESLAPLLPPLLDRLRSLRAIHADAATASETLDRIEKRQMGMAGEIKEWKEGLDKVEAAMQAGEASIADNMKVVEGWVRDLETRMAKLA